MDTIDSHGERPVPQDDLESLEHYSASKSGIAAQYKLRVDEWSATKEILAATCESGDEDYNVFPITHSVANDVPHVQGRPLTNVRATPIDRRRPFSSTRLTGEAEIDGETRLVEQTYHFPGFARRALTKVIGQEPTVKRTTKIYQR